MLPGGARLSYYRGSHLVLCSVYNYFARAVAQLGMQRKLVANLSLRRHGMHTLLEYRQKRMPFVIFGLSLVLLYTRCALSVSLATRIAYSSNIVDSLARLSIVNFVRKISLTVPISSRTMVAC